MHSCGDVSKIKGQVVIITGASSGIGAELAEQYGRKGAIVVIAARRKAQLEAVAAKVTAAGASGVTLVQTDMSQAADCERLIATAVERWGRIDTLVLNHAQFDDGLAQHWNSSADVDATLLAQMKTNVGGVAYSIRAALPHLEKTRGIVGVVTSASVKCPAPFHPGYVASKSALHGLIDTWRHELRLTGTPVDLQLLVLGMIATPEVIVDKELAGFAMPVDACAAEMLCALQARWDETLVPKYLSVWNEVLRAGGRSFLEWAMEKLYISKVPRYVNAIRAVKEARAAAK